VLSYSNHFGIRRVLNDGLLGEQSEDSMLACMSRSTCVCWSDLSMRARAGSVSQSRRSPLHGGQQFELSVAADENLVFGHAVGGFFAFGLRVASAWNQLSASQLNMGGCIRFQLCCVRGKPRFGLNPQAGLRLGREHPISRAQVGPESGGSPVLRDAPFIARVPNRFAAAVTHNRGQLTREASSIYSAARLRGSELGAG
jgi:hypothetical protein